MFERFKNIEDELDTENVEGGEQTDVFFKKEQEGLQDIAEGLVKEKSSERRRKRSGKLAMAVFASLVAFSPFAKSQEVSAQEVGSVAMAVELSDRDEARRERENLIKELNLEQIVDDAQEKLDSLTNTFAGDLFFIDWMRYRFIYSMFSVLEGGLDSGNPLSESTLRKFVSDWQSLSPEKTQERLQREVEVMGFENSGYELTNEEIADRLKGRYSANWLSSVGQIVFIPEILTREFVTNNDTLEARVGGTALSVIIRKSVARIDSRDSVSIFQPSNEYENEDHFIDDYIIPLMRHEVLGHSSDWESSVLLAPEERLKFFYEVVQQYKKPDRFSTGYTNIMDEQWAYWRERDSVQAEVSYMAVREYWAELVETYFISRGSSRALGIFERTYPGDFELVDKWVKYIEGISS